MPTSFRLVLAILAGTVLGCKGEALTPTPVGPPLAAEQSVSTSATIRFVPIEGNCWILQTPEGSYEPIGLPARYRRNGLRVNVVLRGAPTAVSTCMIATLVLVESVSGP